VQDVALLAVLVVDQRDVRRPVRVVLDVRDLAGTPCLSRLKSIRRYCRFAPPPRRRDVMWPWWLRPPDFLIGSSSDFSGSSA
jgi:hypothetical protein